MNNFISECVIYVYLKIEYNENNYYCTYVPILVSLFSIFLNENNEYININFYFFINTINPDFLLYVYNCVNNSKIKL